MKNVISGCDDLFRRINANQYMQTDACIALNQQLDMLPAGGAYLVGNGGDVNTFGFQSDIFVGRNFSVAMLVTPKWFQLACAPIIAATDGTNQLVLSFGANAWSDASDWGVFLSTSQGHDTGNALIPGKLCGELRHKTCLLILSVKDGVPTLFFNGKKLEYTNPPLTYGELTIYRVFGGLYTGYGQFNGIVHEAKVYSYPITPDEVRLSFGLPRFVRETSTNNNAARGGAGWGSCQSYSATSNSVFAACNLGIPGTFGWEFDGDPLMPGDQVRVRFKVSDIGPGSWSIQGYSVALNYHEGGNTTSFDNTGTVDWTYTAVVPTRALVVMNSNYHYAYQHVFLENIVIEVFRKTYHEKINRRGVTSSPKTIGGPFDNTFVANTIPADGFSNPSWNGNTLTVTEDIPSVAVRIKPFHSRDGYIYPGEIVKLKIESDVDLATINALNVVGSIVWSYEGINTTRPAGTYTIYYRSRFKLHLSELCFFVYIANAGVAHITFHEVVIEGVLCDWRKDSMVNSGTWVDMSGNCFDLMSGVAANGVTPINPVAQIERVHNATTAYAGVGAGTTTNVVCKTGAKANVATEWRLNSTCPGGLVVQDVVPDGLSTYARVFNSTQSTIQTNGFTVDIIQRFF